MEEELYSCGGADCILNNGKVVFCCQTQDLTHAIESVGYTNDEILKKINEARNDIIIKFKK
jgi:hypothetical protein